MNINFFSVLEADSFFGHWESPSEIALRASHGIPFDASKKLSNWEGGENKK